MIDDAPDARQILERLIRKWGHRGVSADSGEAGLARIATEKPDLIIVDGMMHGMNGVELIRLLRADEHTAIIPVILQMAVEDHTFRENAIGKGGSEIWIKTKVAIEQMRQRVATYFEARAE